MASIFLIRHGEVAGNSGERLFFSGWDDVSLTPRGERQAQAVAHRLENQRLDAVYASDLGRARRTAETIAEPHRLPVVAQPAWRESNFGDWNGCSEAEIHAGWADAWARRQADPVHVAPPNGESLLDLAKRVQPAWEKIVASHEHDTVALVAHQGTVRAILCLLLEIPLRNYRTLRIANCSLTKVEVVAGKPVIVSVNDTHHLLDIE